MGHLAGKDLFRRLGEKLDSISCRTPWNDTFREILVRLFSETEADVLVRMPAGMSTLGRLSSGLGIDEPRLRGVLEGMAAKGLVVDLVIKGEAYYMPAPIVIGFFEFTMMRLKGADAAAMARLFHDYIESGGRFYKANFGDGQKVAAMRALPHEGTLRPEEALEVLDFEKASAIVGAADRISLGTCACRHKARHLGSDCDKPAGVCTSLGYAADFLIRRGLAREATRGEALDALARSRDLGMVLNADNVQRNVTFICHCCKCCCMALGAISKYGYPNAVVTSNYICAFAEDACNGCGRCARECPVSAIAMAPGAGVLRSPGAGAPVGPPKAPGKPCRPVLDAALCLGCGVCAVKCPKGAAKLVRRGQRVIHPETTFRKVILGCLERGTLQNQLFDDPDSVGQSFMRAVVGAFLGLAPVKKALMSSALRSVFLRGLEAGVRRKGDGWVTEL